MTFEPIYGSLSTGSWWTSNISFADINTGHVLASAFSVEMRSQVNKVISFYAKSKEQAKCQSRLEETKSKTFGWLRDVTDDTSKTFQVVFPEALCGFTSYFFHHVAKKFHRRHLGFDPEMSF